MSDLPPGWIEASLDEIAEVRLGRQRSPKNHAGLRMRPYVRAANVTWNGLDLRDVKEMNFTKAESLIYELRPGDIILAEASGSPGEVGKPAIWREEIPDCCFQNTLVRVRTHGVDPDFLKTYFFAEAKSGRLGGASRGVGIHHIGSQRLASWKVPLPPLGEQRRILAAIEEQFSRLDAAESALTAARRRIQILAQVAAESAVVSEGSPSTIGETAEVQGGIQKQPKRRPHDNRFPFLRVANVKRGHLDLDEIHEVELFNGELEKLALRPGDLLVVEGNGSPDQIGRSALWRGEIPDCVHQNHLIRVRPGEAVDPEYLNLLWNAPSTAERIASVASSTSGLYTLSTAKVRSLEIVLPAPDEQRRIVAEVEQRLSLIASMREAVNSAQRRSAALRRAILERAFRGELVPQDPSDEHASVLLERIRAERAAQPKPGRGRRRAGASNSS